MVYRVQVPTSSTSIQLFDFQLESGTPLATWGPRTQWWPPGQPHPSQPCWPPASSKTTNTTGWSRSSGKFTEKCSRMWSRVVLRTGRLNRFVGNPSRIFFENRSTCVIVYCQNESFSSKLAKNGGFAAIFARSGSPFNKSLGLSVFCFSNRIPICK